MPQFAKILNGTHQLAEKSQVVVEDYRTKMVQMTGKVISKAKKQKQKNIYTIETIALAGFDMRKDDPVISNQGSLTLQDDETINRLDKELLQGLAKCLNAFFYMTILIVTTTEKRGKFVPIQISSYPNDEYSMFQYIDDPKVNKMVDRYLGAVNYHPFRHTRKQIFRDAPYPGRTMRTRQCFVSFDTETQIDGSLGDPSKCNKCLIILAVVIVLFLLFCIFCIYQTEIESAIRFIKNMFN